MVGMVNSRLVVLDQLPDRECGKRWLIIRVTPSGVKAAVRGFDTREDAFWEVMTNSCLRGGYGKWPIPVLSTSVLLVDPVVVEKTDREDNER